jgi:hypothetical protein
MPSVLYELSIMMTVPDYPDVHDCFLKTGMPERRRRADN